MRYKENFIKVVNSGNYLGTGNPNSEILVVGKEVATDENSVNDPTLEEQNKFNYENNISDWLKNIQQNKNQEDVPNWIYDDPLKINNPLFAFKGAEIKEEGKTWRKYQKLHDYIFGMESRKNISKYGHNFQERFFITEMSDIPSKRTIDAQKRKEFKKRLEKRKNGFFKSSFIQNFPVIILACSNYIYGKEIENIFGVNFIEQKGIGKQLFWTHLNLEKTKLVIHTRQLSTNVSNELLQGIANEIIKFLGNENPAHNKKYSAFGI
jgi:hypothetical protein